MSDDYNYEEAIANRERFKEAQRERKSHKDIYEKDTIPHFFPTFRVKSRWYPLPIILTVALAGVLAYITYVLAEIQVEGGYVSEEEYGAAGGLINGLIFTGYAVASAFIMILLIKRYGINALKFIFGASFAFLSFFLTLFYGGIIIYLYFITYAPTEGELFWIIINFILPIMVGVFTIGLIYKYLATESFPTKNFVVLYIGLLIGATMGTIMPLWTTLAILIGISIWDIFAVKSKYGPIKQMIDIVSNPEQEEPLSEEDLKERIESGELIYDTSKLEIGIGDLAFYSMLTSSALIQTGNIIIMLLTALAVIIGTGITISGLKRNKILPGLPISIFLGIGTMLGSWTLFSIFF